MSRGGVYIYRCRKPAARFRIPILSWHFAYVGETTSFWHRHRQHMGIATNYTPTPQPWTDRDPYVWLRIPLPPWKWLLRSVETLAILAVWPVYNISKNRWNPRRIKPWTAQRQRQYRDVGAWAPSATRWYHVALILAVAAGLWMMIGGGR
jgi:hypothetical protein